MQTFAPAYPQGIPVSPPTRIKVFGILHIVFAGIGILVALGQSAMLMFKDQIRSFGASGGVSTAQERQLEVQRRIEEATGAYNLPFIGMEFLLCGVMLVAGILLVKHRRNALKWSNGYAWFSITCKLATIALYLGVILPAVNAEFDQMLGANGAARADKTAQAMLTGMKIAMSAAGVLSPLIASIYPILALAMLNKPSVRTALGLEPGNLPNS